MSINHGTCSSSAVFDLVNSSIHLFLLIRASNIVLSLLFSFWHKSTEEPAGRDPDGNFFVWLNFTSVTIKDQPAMIFVVSWRWCVQCIHSWSSCVFWEDWSVRCIDKKEFFGGKMSSTPASHAMARPRQNWNLFSSILLRPMSSKWNP